MISQQLNYKPSNASDAKIPRSNDCVAKCPDSNAVDKIVGLEKVFD